MIRLHRKRRGSRGGRPLLFCFFGWFVLGLFVGTLAGHGADEPLRGPGGPEKGPGDPEENLTDLSGFPDPFQSYLVARQEELKRLEWAKMQKDAAQVEERKRQRLSAEETLRAFKEPKTELQKVDISQLTVSAVVLAKDKAWALVSDPKGMGYVIKEGTPIGRNGGVVDKVIRKAEKTPIGKEYVRTILIKEPYLLDNEITIQYKWVEMKMADEEFQ